MFEAIDILVNLSKNHFGTLTCDNGDNIIIEELLCKLNNSLKIEMSTFQGMIRRDKH